MQAEAISQHLVAIISSVEASPVSSDQLGFSEVQDLYSLLGIIASTEAVPEDFRVNLLNWALERQSQRLVQCPPEQKELVGQILLTIKTVT